MSPPLVQFALLLIAGFLGAAATGKLVPHARWIAETFDVSLGWAGFAISAVMLTGALLSAAMGAVTNRFGPKTVTISGLLVTAMSSMMLGTSEHFWMLVLVRLFEGIGYSLLVVSATVLVVEVSTQSRQTLALAVWSSFAPIGFALGQWAASYADGAQRLTAIGHWHGALLLLVAAFIALALPSRDEHIGPAGRSSAFDAIRHRPALLASLAFGCVTGVLLAAVAVTPLVLAEANGIPVAEAARLTALAALPGILGRFGAGWLLGWRMTPRAVLMSAGIAGSVLIAIVLLARVPLGIALGVFTLFQILLGVMPGVLSAMIPHVAPARDQIGMVSGMVNQMVTLGNLVGPPLVLSVFAVASAPGAVVALVVWTAVCIALIAGVAPFRKPVG